MKVPAPPGHIMSPPSEDIDWGAVDDELLQNLLDRAHSTARLEPGPDREELFRRHLGELLALLRKVSGQ